MVDRNPKCQFAGEVGADPTSRLVVKDWGGFFDHYLEEATLTGPGEAGDAIVPSPLMPHLMYEWLLRRARARWPGRVVETRPVPDQGRRTIGPARMEPATYPTPTGRAPRTA